MNNVYDLLLPAATGAAAGVFFFGGLWLTVQKAMGTKMPAIWFILSFIIRVAVTMLAFYGVGVGSLQRTLFCMAGFLLARVVVTRVTRNWSPQKQQTHEAKS